MYHSTGLIYTTPSAVDTEFREREGERRETGSRSRRVVSQASASDMQVVCEFDGRHVDCTGTASVLLLRLSLSPSLSPVVALLPPIKARLHLLLLPLLFQLIRGDGSYTVSISCAVSDVTVALQSALCIINVHSSS
jgi:hypothetical protein